jgi:hypothetical protein
LEGGPDQKLTTTTPKWKYLMANSSVRLRRLVPHPIEVLPTLGNEDEALWHDRRKRLQKDGAEENPGEEARGEAEDPHHRTESAYEGMAKKMELGGSEMEHGNSRRNFSGKKTLHLKDLEPKSLSEALSKECEPVEACIPLPVLNKS